MRLTRSIFHRLLLLALRYRKSSLGLLGLIFFVAMGIFILSLQGRTGLIRIQFFPDNYSLFYAELTGPAGTPIETTHELIKKMAARISRGSEGQAESALGFAGYYINEDFSPQYGNNLGYVAVTLPSVARRHFADFPENDVVAQFKSYVQPLIIIAAVVFALTGVVFGAGLSRTVFTINSFVAVIGVTGVVVNDSLVLVEFINSSLSLYSGILQKKDGNCGKKRELRNTH